MTGLVRRSHRNLASGSQTALRDYYAWGGCYSRTLHGPRKAVVPPGWDWPAAVVGALLEYVGYAFEKSDSQERWGSENVFAAVAGGRSLRFTGESVYSTSCQQGDMGDEPEENQLPKLAASDCEEPTDATLDGIGGRYGSNSSLNYIHFSQDSVENVVLYKNTRILPIHAVRLQCCTGRSSGRSSVG
jgi:hypothetical protein